MIHVRPILSFKVISSKPVLYSFRAPLYISIDGLFVFMNSKTLVLIIAYEMSDTLGLKINLKLHPY